MVRVRGGGRGGFPYIFPGLFQKGDNDLLLFLESNGFQVRFLSEGREKFSRVAFG